MVNIDRIINLGQNWLHWLEGEIAQSDATPITNHKIDIAGVKPSDPRETIFYRKLGRGKNLLFLVPGNNTCGTCYAALLNRFAANPAILNHYTLVAPDYRGSGQSSYHRPITSLADFAHDFDQIVTTLLAESSDMTVTLVGYSMGFAVALEMMLLRPNLYQKIIGLAPAGVRGYNVRFGKEQAGFDGKNHWHPGDFVPNHDDAIGLAATAFNQRASEGMGRNPISIKTLWDFSVFNDALKFNLPTMSAGDFALTLSPFYAQVLHDVLTIKFMPASLYYLHKFNVAHLDGGVHINKDGRKIIRGGDGRLGRLCQGKQFLLIKAATDYRHWRGDVVIRDTDTATSKYDLTEAGGAVHVVMIDPDQGYDHGLPIVKPDETMNLIHQFCGGGLNHSSVAEALAGARFQYYDPSERNFALRHGLSD